MSKHDEKYKAKRRAKHKARHHAKHEAQRVAKQVAHEEEAAHQESEGHEHEDLVVVPKGKSKLQFLFTLGLTIFVLLIFTVGGSVRSSMGGLFGGGGGETLAVSWTDPLSKVAHEVQYPEFQRRSAALGRLATFGAFQPRHSPEGKSSRVTPEDTALVLVLEQMALDAGIGVSETEFAGFLTAVFRSGENVSMQARRFGQSTPAFEQDLKQMLVVQKLMTLLQLGVGQVSPRGGLTGAVEAESVESLWEERHPQYSFQYVEVEGASYEEEARDGVLGDEELEAWYHNLPTWRQEQHFSEERYLPQVAYVTLGADFDATALLEKYPPPEGLDLESQATSYYNRFNNVRFKTDPVDPVDPVDLVDDDADDADADDADADADADVDVEGEGDPDDVDGDPDDAEEQDQAPQLLYRPYEEVADVCRAEAPLHAALVAWHADIRQRLAAAAAKAAIETPDENGETPDGNGETPDEIDPDAVDFAAEADAFGLTLDLPPAALTREEIEAAKDWGGKFVGNQFSFAREGELLASVVVEEGAMMVVLLKRKEPRAEPPFADMRDAIVDEWAKERATDLAVEKLEALRDGFGERPVEETEEPPEEPEDGQDTDGGDATDTTDTTDATDATDATEQEPWRPVVTAEAFRTAVEAAGLTVVDRPWLEQFAVPDDDFDAMTEGDRHIRVSRDLFELEEGQTVPATANAAGTHALLIRFSGERTKPFDEITAKELLTLRSAAAAAAAQGLDDEVFKVTSDWFKSTFQIDMDSWHRDEADEADEENDESE